MFLLWEERWSQERGLHWPRVTGILALASRPLLHLGSDGRCRYCGAVPWRHRSALQAVWTQTPAAVPECWPRRPRGPGMPGSFAGPQAVRRILSNPGLGRVLADDSHHPHSLSVGVKQGGFLPSCELIKMKSPEHQMTILQIFHWSAHWNYTSLYFVSLLYLHPAIKHTDYGESCILRLTIH